MRPHRAARRIAYCAIATLALCIGANTTVFSVLYGMILKPLPRLRLDQTYLSKPLRVSTRRSFADTNATAGFS